MNEIVRASSGCGKSTLLVKRVKELLESGIDPSKMLIFTFTKYSAQDLVSKIGKVDGLTVGTMHSVFYSTLLDLWDKPTKPRLMSEAEIGFFVGRNKERDVEYKEAVLGLTNLINRGRGSYADKALLRKFTDHKDQNNLITFDDMLYKTLDLIKKYPDKAQKWQDKWSHIFVDEFQDSNALQVSLLQFLVAKGSHLFAIGDAKQAIYAFRGGESKFITDFDKYFGDHKISHLKKTYRLSKAVTKASNMFVQRVFFNEPEIETNNQSKGKFVCYDYGSVVSEMEDVLDSVKHTRDTLILTRNNNTLIPYQYKLIRDNISFMVLGEDYFYNDDTIKKLVSIATVLLEPSRATSSELSIICTLVAQKKYQGTIRFRTGSIMSFIESKCENDTFYWRVLDKIKKARSFCEKQSRLSAVFAYIVKEFDFVKYYSYGKSEDEIYAMKETIEAFVGVMCGIRNLREYAMLVERQKGNVEPPKLRLSTIHKSKGLEADDVFVVAINSDCDRTPDEDCLYYVAITRARENLWVSGSTKSPYLRLLKKIYEEIP